MLYVIQTNQNRQDFQSRIIRIKDMSWNEFKNRIINQKESDIYFNILDSTMKGCVLPRLTKIDEISINDEVHLEVKFKIWNGDNICSRFYKIPEGNFNMFVGIK